MKKVFLFLTCNVFACIASIEKHFLTTQTTHDLGQRNRYQEGQDISFETIVTGWFYDSDSKTLVLANIEIIRERCFFGLVTSVGKRKNSESP